MGRHVTPLALQYFAPWTTASVTSVHCLCTLKDLNWSMSFYKMARVLARLMLLPAHNDQYLSDDINVLLCSSSYTLLAAMDSVHVFIALNSCCSR